MEHMRDFFQGHVFNKAQDDHIPLNIGKSLERFLERFTGELDINSVASILAGQSQFIVEGGLGTV